LLAQWGGDHLPGLRSHGPLLDPAGRKGLARISHWVSRIAAIRLYRMVVFRKPRRGVRFIAWGASPRAREIL